MCKYSEIHRYCGTKMKLSKTEKTRHNCYIVRLSDNIIPLPTLITVSRGNGEIANNNFKGIAKALGLSEFELTDSIGCNLGRECVYLCLCARLLKSTKERIIIDPIVHREEEVIEIDNSINIILKDIFSDKIINFSKNEKNILSKRINDLNDLKKIKLLSKICIKLIEIIEKLIK